MVRPLAWTAIAGLSVGVISLSIAYAMGDRAMHRLADPATYLTSSCSGIGVAASTTPSERRLAWSGGDTVEVAVPATVRYRGGEGDEVIVRGPSDVIAQVTIDGGRIRLDCRVQARLHDVEIILPGRKFSRVASRAREG